jgi:predicted choloylglycine hydrolase
MIKEQTLFNRPESFMTVRRLEIHGTNFEIGRQLGLLARKRYRRSLENFKADPAFAKARRTYFERNYPIHWERVRGVAAAFEIDPNDDRYDLTGLPYNTDLPAPPPGCSVVYYPPSTTATGGGFLSRNYDFPIGSIADLMQVPLPPALKAAIPPVMSEPYIMVWHPEDGGRASLAIHGFDLLSGTLDGMNDAGLVVSILADEEAAAALGPNLERHAGSHNVVGLHELQVMRFLLDTCATSEEAKTALLAAKQYYSLAPCHYIVADQAGNSFVYENSTGRNVQHMIDGKGRPQIITNHQLHTSRAAEDSSIEALTLENNSRWRYRTLLDRVAAHRGPFTAADLKASNACVNISELLKTIEADPTQRSIAAGINSRTLWHSLYDQNARNVEFSFYLGEDAQPGGARTERRSDYVKLSL